MNGIGSHGLGSLDNIGPNQIAFGGRSGTDVDRFVCVSGKNGLLVCIRVNGHGFYAHFTRSFHDAQGNFTSIRY